MRVSLLARYSALPSLAGAAFIPIALIARLPLAMLTIGTLALVSVASGSYALGGLAAGAVGVGSAAGAPALGLLADRYGQRRTVLIAGVLNTVATTAVVVATYPPGGLHASGPLPLLAVSLVAGLTLPQVGPLARARWMALTERRPLRELERDAAFSYESTADELTFVLGPALVGALGAAVAPWLPLALAVLLTAVFVTAFALHPTATAVHRSAGAVRPAAVRAPAAAPGFGGWGLAALPVAGMLAMGGFFGSTQTALTAFAGELGAAETAGLLYAALGLTSAVAALTVAAWSARFTLAARWTACAGALTALAFLMLVPHSLGAMAAMMLLIGVPVGPIMVTVYGLGGRLAPAGRMGTAMTALASGLVAGVALGAGIAGALAEAGGASAAFAAPLASAGILLLLGSAALLVPRGRVRVAA
ncbi:MFS family permease [Sinomonas atrocyanea]|uniref:MFS transporter n=1 Tax=Sinomonas atrocyanea TaxID=37927 RepID=UPI00278A6FC5|nr:MFS transporter [Sinomonas atrocyanea]MDP9883678.1 MFS family permease [Sinomonas atrocyanea]